MSDDTGREDVEGRDHRRERSRRGLRRRHRRGRRDREGARSRSAVAGAGPPARPWASSWCWRRWPAHLPARAYDAATTHAGLTQQAAVASVLHAVLARRLGRADGLFQSVALHAELLPVNQRRLLQAKLSALDPAGGYRPSDDGVAPALAWTMAGSVLELTPPERIQNHFLDPSTGQGLRDDAQPDAFFHALRMMFDGSNGVRGVATGTSFSFEGRSSLDWLTAPENEQGLPVF